MKNLKYKYVSILILLIASGCKNYLDVVPEGDIQTIETTFEKKEDAYNWLKTCYSMIVYETGHVAICPAYWGADEVVADDWFRINSQYSIGDLAHTYQSGIYIGDGLQMAQNPYGDVWSGSKFYGGIRYCNLFLDHIDGVYNKIGRAHV